MSAIRVGGHFLDSDHTVKYCRDQLIPGVFQRQGRDDCEKSGRRTAFHQARDMALAAIKTAPPEGVLSTDQNQEIASLAKQADKLVVEAYSGNIALV